MSRFLFEVKTCIKLYIIDKRINANEAVDRMNDKDHRFLFTGMNPSF